MKRLTLMRHATAQWKDPQTEDFDRPLNRRGQSEAATMSRRLAQLNFVPTLVLTSSARRAEQTAGIVARELGILPRLVRSEEALYLAAAAEILALVQSTGPRIPHLLIVGHNPGISEAIQLLAPQTTEPQPLQTAALCSLTFDARAWGAVGPATFQHSCSEAPRARRFGLWA